MSELWWLPPALLMIVFAHHRWRVHSVGQSAWKGGGFGMFSETDRTAIAVVLWAIDNDGVQAPIRLDPGVSQTITTVVPTPSNIVRWGRELAKTDWQRCGDVAHPRPPSSSAPSLMITQVHLRRLWVSFDVRAGEYRTEMRSEVTVDR